MNAPCTFPRDARVPHRSEQLQMLFAPYIREDCIPTEPLIDVFTLPAVLDAIQLLRVGYATPVVLNALFSLLPA